VSGRTEGSRKTQVTGEYRGNFRGKKKTLKKKKKKKRDRTHGEGGHARHRGIRGETNVTREKGNGSKFGVSEENAALTGGRNKKRSLEKLRENYYKQKTEERFKEKRQLKLRKKQGQKNIEQRAFPGGCTKFRPNRKGKGRGKKNSQGGRNNLV